MKRTLKRGFNAVKIGRVEARDWYVCLWRSAVEQRLLRRRSRTRMCGFGECRLSRMLPDLAPS